MYYELRLSQTMNCITTTIQLWLLASCYQSIQHCLLSPVNIFTTTSNAAGIILYSARNSSYMVKMNSEFVGDITSTCAECSNHIPNRKIPCWVDKAITINFMKRGTIVPPPIWHWRKFSIGSSTGHNNGWQSCECWLIHFHNSITQNLMPESSLNPCAERKTTCDTPNRKTCTLIAGQRNHHSNLMLKIKIMPQLDSNIRLQQYGKDASKMPSTARNFREDIFKLPQK